MTAIILYFLVCKILGENFDWVCAIGNLLNLQGIFFDSLVSPFWSLSYEVWFYIILGTFAALFLKNKIGLFAFVIAVAVFVSGFPETHRQYIYIWIIGAAAYLSCPKTRSKWILILSAIGILLGVAAYQMSKPSISLNMPIKIPDKKLIELFIALMMSLFMQQIILFEPKHKLTRMIEGGLGYMAKFSYTLYLSHRIVFLILFAYVFEKGAGMMNLKSMVLYVLFVVITLFSCWVIYLFSERYSVPLKLRMKKKLIK